jgi:leucyl/phenylalanyl-tRNA--protein transferase
VTLIDCQQETGHLASLGAVPIPRRDFLRHLRHAIAEPPIERWEITPPLTT